jgi:hypothetical protein
LYLVTGVQTCALPIFFTSYTYRACTKIRLLTQDSGDSTAVTLNIKC